MADMKAALAAYGAPPGQIHIEIFNGREAMSPGVVRAAVRNPHMSPNDVDTGRLVSFARSGIAAHWNRAVYQSILEISGSLRCPGPLVVPGRRLSQLRKRLGLRGRSLLAGTARQTSRGQHPGLLLTTGSRCRDRSVMPSALDLRHCRRADSIRQATHIQEPENANDLNGPRIANMYFVQTLTVASSGRRGMAH